MESALAPKQRKGKELAKRLSSGSVKRPPKVDRALAPCKKQTEGKISTNQSAQANISKHTEHTKKGPSGPNSPSGPIYIP